MAAQLNREQGTVVLERVPFDAAAWDVALAGYPRAEVFHSSAWLAYLQASQNAEPVLAVVRAGSRPIGHFVGAIVRRFGLRILGSPLRGWGTQSMGFLLDDESARGAAASALVPFAFQDLGCVHLELTDRRLTASEIPRSRYLVEEESTMTVDLTPPDEIMMKAMRSTTRNYISQALRKGLRIEIATDADFASEYHNQLTDDFAAKGLVPTYGVDRVRLLIAILQPTGQLLLLRVRSPDGTSLATALVLGRNEIAVLWGAAFDRAHKELHPNELLHWEAMRYWKARGASRYDMAYGPYKAKFGAVPTPAAPHLHCSRFALLRHARTAFRDLVRMRQMLRALPARFNRSAQR